MPTPVGNGILFLLLVLFVVVCIFIAFGLLYFSIKFMKWLYRLIKKRWFSS